MHAELAEKARAALMLIEPLAAQGDEVAVSIERQLRWCLALARDERPAVPGGPFSMGLMATREYDMWGDQPEIARAVNAAEFIAAPMLDRMLAPRRNESSSRAFARELLRLLAILAWSGVALQLLVSVELGLRTAGGIRGALVSFFGYFTVLTNIFVAVMATLSVRGVLVTGSEMPRRTSIMGCATAAIILVGVAYHLLLRNVWSPQGPQLVADYALHYVVPIATASVWCFYEPRARLPWWHPLAWCGYVLAYIVYVLVRAQWTGTYPYHFIDVGTLGLPVALRNALGLLAAYAGIGYAVWGISRWRHARGPRG